MVWAGPCFLTHFNISRTFCGICLRANQGYSCQILALFIPREEAKKFGILCEECEEIAKEKN